jgi:hypothetical protein
MRFSANIAMLLMIAGALFVSSNEGNAYIACDTHQMSNKPTTANAVSSDLVIPFGYLCHHLEVENKKIAIQKASFSSNATVEGPLVGGICNWRIDFVYYSKGKEDIRDKGKTVKGCDKGAFREIAKGKTLPEFSSSCAELFVDGEVRLIQCRKIVE